MRASCRRARPTLHLCEHGASGNIRYGAAAAVLVVIIWLWIFALITVVGAQINAIAMGLQPMAYDLARTVELVYEDHDLEAHVKGIHTYN
jgi:uncharacterized BrkB/YihY/UPF0761 family membrane protein